MLRMASVLGVGLALLAGTVQADVKLPKIFGDNMVLQQGMAVPVWGTAAANEKVTVTFGDKTAEATADADGKWSLKLPESPASAEPKTLTVKGNNEVTFKNVLVGEVWVCSGQSNMEWPISMSLNPKEETAAANFPQIRMITVPHGDARQGATPQTDFAGSWSECSPSTIANFSAVAYFFGREIHQQRKVPVGLIHTSFGGTPAEFWVPPSAFAADPVLKETGEHMHAKNVMQTPSILWNSMVAPLVPYAIKGVIWYQGESNVPMAKQYYKLFPGMIKGWRSEWNQGDFPFLFVQIAPWNYGLIKEWPREGAPVVRDAQFKTLAATPNTGMVVTTDIGDVNDIHPRNKQEVGKRLALAARKLAYGEDVVYSGPLYKAMHVDGNKILITFDHAAGLKLKDGDKLIGFQIAGADKKFVDATAMIDGEKVIVTSDQVAEPKHVRLGFTDVSVPNLLNGAGLPASPFRTDED